ncbi:MAG: amidohydrolase family protein [Betaproteobacteria bacterium]|nr:amidohydrolase family protein [Betaproteobacteria bacterium]
MHDLMIRGVHPWKPGSGDAVDIAVDAGRISLIAKSVPETGREEWHVGGRLLLPALADPHHHLDKACLVGRVGASTDLADARARFGKLRPNLTPEDHRQRGERVIQWAISHGVATLRTHADVDKTVGLRHVEAALALREAFSDRITIQVVAFLPASAPVNDEESWRALADALHLGCDAVGGATGNRGAEAPTLMRRTLELAEKAGGMVDLHLDETLEPAVQNMAELARLTRGYGLEGRVAASHCCSLAVAPAAVRAEAIGLAAEARLHVIALPLTNLYLQGRESGLRGVPPVAEILAAGINVACGSDNVQDPFLPTGNADPLLAAQVLGIVAQLADPDFLLEAVSLRAAHAMGLSADTDWCRTGAPACFAVADCGPEDDPVARLAPRPLVVFNGRVVRRPGDGAHDLPPIRTSQQEE